MKLSAKRLFVALSGLMFCGSALALPGLTNSYSQDVIVIENNIDGNVAITPLSFEPRLIGTNGTTGEWDEYVPTTGSVVGYMGHGEPRPVYDGQFVDIWLEGFPAISPLQGLACEGLDEWDCALGYFEPTRIDKQGVYKIPIEYVDNQSDYGALSMTAFIAYRNMKVGNSFSFVYNSCMTDKDYELSMGETCARVEPDAWKRYSVKHNKVAHLKLNNMNVNAEVYINTDGVPSLGLGGHICSISNVGGVDGLTCTIVDYSLESAMANNNNILVHMKLDQNMLGFAPAASQLKFRIASGAWSNYNVPMTFSQLGLGNKIEVFFSNSLMKKMLTDSEMLNDGSIMSKMISFKLENTMAGEQGFYNFATSSSIYFRSGYYGISILPIKAVGRGIVGSAEPIRLSYEVITSGPRQADLITAQIGGDNFVGDKHYCSFDSPDKSFSVKFPSYLVFKDQAGVEQRVYSGCKHEETDITKALWVQGAPVSAELKGYSYKTQLDIIFPMDDPISETQAGSNREWFGTVHAEGTVIVKAIWRNVKSN